MKNTLLAAVAAATVFVSTAASAATLLINWSLSGSGEQGHGTLMTSVSQVPPNGQIIATGGDGEINGHTVTLLPPGPGDNKIYLDGVPGATLVRINLAGLVFAPDTGENIHVHISGASATSAEYALNQGSVSRAITFNAAVPEPATWTMMLVGFGAIGACLRQRRLAALI